jgi:predicted kinase
MTPFFLVDREDRERRLITISQTARCDWLGLLARADALGRVAADRQHLLDSVALFEEYAREHECLDRPFPFASEHSRFEYFRKSGRDPRYRAHDDPACLVTVMSGLPGSGKDTWIGEHASGLPTVSLDDIRQELQIAPDEPQGAVIQAARDRARTLLRAGTSFVWNATNVSRNNRGQVITLLAEYRARVRIVYCETDPKALGRRNRSRPSPRPAAVVARLLDRWQVPDLTEAHEVVYAPGKGVAAAEEGR